jgi:hypothetical protein
LRINQSNQFSSGVWFGSSNIYNATDKYIATGSNGGTTSSRVYMYGGTYNGSNVIALDGSDGRIKGSYYAVSGTTVIDSSRNLTNIGTINSGAITSTGISLFGKTVADNTTNGIRIDGTNDFVSIVRDGDLPLLLNRKTSDGILLELRKDGTSVGSIGVIDADLTIYTSTSGHKGLRFGNGYIAPTDNTGTITDNTTDLGLSSQRFKDLHLSGTISSGDISIGTDSGDPFNANAKIKIQDSGTAYIQIKTGTANSGGLLIGDTADDFVGGFIYNNSNNHLSLYSNDNISLELDDNYDVNVYQGGLQIGGTEVISSSRNLTNIGTISSGAITSSGVIDVHTGDSGIILKSDRDWETLTS